MVHQTSSAKRKVSGFFQMRFAEVLFKNDDDKEDSRIVMVMIIFIFIIMIVIIFVFMYISFLCAENSCGWSGDFCG